MWSREGHEDNASPASAVLKASIPESTYTGNLSPRNADSVHPFFCKPLRALSCPEGSRKVWVTQSVVRCRKRIPRPHHFRRRFCAFSTVPILVFILAWPFTQSTIVLLSPLISNVGLSLWVPVFQGQGRSLGFFVGTRPLDSFFLSTGCFID